MHWINPRNSARSSDDEERAGRLVETINALYEANRFVPIIVEGKRDAFALRGLGIEGEIVELHRGKGLYDFCEDILERYDRVIVLMDWDAKGDELQKVLEKNLIGRWEEFSSFRELFKILCQKDIKDIEGIPKLLGRLGFEEINRQ